MPFLRAVANGCVTRVVLQVAPEGLHRGERRQSGGFGAQSARSEPHRLEPAQHRGFDVLGGEPRFASRQHDHLAVDRRQSRQPLRGPRLQNQAERASGHAAQPLRQIENRAHLRDPIAPALLARRLDDPLPVLCPALGALILEPHLAATRRERLYPCHAELDRFPYGEFHAIAARDYLRQPDRERRFALDGIKGFAAHAHCVAVARTHHGSILAPRAVEEHDRVAGSEPQHAREVMRGRASERHVASDLQMFRMVNSGKTHVARPRTARPARDRQAGNHGTPPFRFTMPRLPPSDALLDAVIAVVRTVAAQEIMPRYQKVAHSRKADGTLLTEADLATQAALNVHLRALADVPLLAEEMTAQRQAEQWLAGGTGLWCVDPIDGTSNFVNGLPYFAVSVALLQHGRPILGVVFDPVADEMFSAAQGRGAFLNGVRLPIKTAVPTFANAMAGVDFKRIDAGLARSLSTAPPFMSQRNFGASTLEWCYTAAGRFDLYLHGGQKLWDYAAGALILAEAGGHCCSLDHDDFWSAPLWRRSVIAALDATLFASWTTWLRTRHGDPG